MTMEDRIALTLKAAAERIELEEGRLDSVGSLDPNPRRTTPRWVAFAGAFGAVILVAFGLSLISSAVLSPDGRYLYLSGNHYMPTTDSKGQLMETWDPLGITVIDTDAWRVVEFHDVPVGSVGGGNGSLRKPSRMCRSVAVRDMSDCAREQLI